MTCAALRSSDSAGQVLHVRRSLVTTTQSGPYKQTKDGDGNDESHNVIQHGHHHPEQQTERHAWIRAS